MSTRDALKLTLAATLLFAAAVTAQGPLPEDEATWVHAPYEVGACAVCHQREDPADPGPVSTAGSELCYQCHDAMQSLISEASTRHFAAEDDCASCHNAHNSARDKGLIAETVALCAECHDDVGAQVTTAAVTHGAATAGAACLACHNPHASNIEKLLHQIPEKMCLGCHGEDGVEDDGGKALTNIGALLAANPEHHGPVATGDCSACHLPHGGDSFRLLALEYPAKFYSPFEPANYELCFTCHDERVVTTPETTTLTNFRDGSRNLHYLHVNKAERGRTCRACHEVHAAENLHIIRDGVPYGSKGWVLPINYLPSANGGQCSKTCHPTRVYDRTASAERMASVQGE